jgi:thioesterase domain-containing protein
MIGNRLRRVRHRWSQRSRAERSTTVSAAEQRRRDVITRSAAALKQYRPHPFAGDLLVFSADERNPKFGPTLGWDRHVSGRIVPVRLDGKHSTLHVEQAGDIARALSDRLGSGQPPHSSTAS